MSNVNRVLYADQDRRLIRFINHNNDVALGIEMRDSHTDQLGNCVELWKPTPWDAVQADNRWLMKLAAKLIEGK